METEVKIKILKEKLIGCIMKTNYSRCSYEILNVFGPCTCVHIVDKINQRNIPQQEHYHFTCCEPGNVRNKSWFNYYIPVSETKFRNLKPDYEGKYDEIEIIDKKTGQQFNLFESV